MTQIGGLFFCLEVLMASAVFVWPCPKRKYFWLRAIISCSVCLLLAYFFPLPKKYLTDVFFTVFRQIILLIYVLAVISVCFDLKIHILISLGLAGFNAQHIAYVIVTLISLTPIFGDFGYGFFNRRLLLECLFMPPIYVMFALTFGLLAYKNEYYKVSNKYLNYLAMFIVILNIVVSRIPRALGENETISVNIYDMIAGLSAMVIQFVIYHISNMAYKNAMEKRLWQEEKKQYEITHDTIEAINIKCHDLKHRLRGFSTNDSKEIGEINDLIRIYDDSIKTGNEVLDVLIMDYKLRFAPQGVQFNYMGDGGELGFMSESDIYSLFGNAFENAVEASLKLKDVSKRQISINIEANGDLVFINVSNYFEGDLVFLGDVLVTSKNYDKDEHGFGLKSMKKIAIKYGGNLRINYENDIFCLGIYLLKN